jgi:nucleotide-binding universal stress UspA family protein
MFCRTGARNAGSRAARIMLNRSRIMYKHLLIAVDESELAFGALKQGVALAEKLGAKVTIVTVTEPWTAVVSGDAAIGFPIDEYQRSVSAWAEDTLARARAVATKAGIDCEMVHVSDIYPADGILATASEKHCDLIVMGSHGRRGLTRLILGSQANNVVTQSTIPVLICR